MDELLHFRSFLFVPGSRPERFAKAIATGADGVCIDLEDAVAPGQKEQALNAVQEFLSASSDKSNVGVRINALEDEQSVRDLAVLSDSEQQPAFVMIPKVTNADEIFCVQERLGDNGPPIWSLIETPEAMLNASDIAEAVGPTGGILFGGVDYSAAIGSDRGWDAFTFARGSLANAAAIGQCQLLDVPYLDVTDNEGMATETRRVKAMGFTGRACIHPKQVSVINEVFSPTAEEIDAAEKIVAAFDVAKGGAALLDGKLIEKPILLSAGRILSAKGR